MFADVKTDELRLTVSEDRLASMEFSISWESPGVSHCDRFFAHRVNLWRDILPPGLGNQIRGKKTGETVGIEYDPGEMFAGRTATPRLQLHRRRIPNKIDGGLQMEPRYGRFYPQGILPDLPGVFRGNPLPFRCVDVTAETVGVDLNHPLSGRKVRLDAVLRDVRPKFEEHGGTVNDWGEIISSGAGMQARIDGKPTDFFSVVPLQRPDEGDDSLFYGKPRLVQHLDDRAIETISEAYGRMIRPGSRVLDLMSSWRTHLPRELALSHLTGLGLNEIELRENPQLDEYRVHDLNRSPRLPFDDNAFDAVVCTASVEYLNRPVTVFQEVARVLSPDGIFIVSFSNRWFPPKAVQIWTELHDFERMGLVAEYFFAARHFHRLGTLSSVGWPRPQHDKYFPQQVFSDPVYMVWGRRR